MTMLQANGKAGSDDDAEDAKEDSNAGVKVGSVSTEPSSWPHKLPRLDR